VPLLRKEIVQCSVGRSGGAGVVMMWTRASDRQEVAPSQTRATIRSKGRRRQSGSSVKVSLSFPLEHVEVR
jgi:hypothetical protein